MDLDHFKKAVDGLDEVDKMIGMIGGEPLIHPDFEEMCLYLQKKFLPAQLGLWSELPVQQKHYAKLISETFGAVLPNDHSGAGIYHSPVMVCSDNLLGEEYKEAMKNCWLQKAWSASVNPHGGFFCEVAAAIDMVLDTGTGFDITDKRWIYKKPSEYMEQIEALCSKCSVSLSLTPRLDNDEIDDIDQWWYEKLKDTSPKIQAGKYKIYNGQMFDTTTNQINSFRKNMDYLHEIGEKFGLDLVLKKNGYLRPYLLGG
jgi:hypothetical protein